MRSKRLSRNVFVGTMIVAWGFVTGVSAAPVPIEGPRVIEVDCERGGDVATVLREVQHGTGPVEIRVHGTCSTCPRIARDHVTLRGIGDNATLQITDACPLVKVDGLVVPVVPGVYVDHAVGVQLRNLRILGRGGQDVAPDAALLVNHGEVATSELVTDETWLGLNAWRSRLSAAGGSVRSVDQSDPWALASWGGDALVSAIGVALRGNHYVDSNSTLSIGNAPTGGIIYSYGARVETSMVSDPLVCLDGSRCYVGDAEALLNLENSWLQITGEAGRVVARRSEIDVAGSVDTLELGWQSRALVPGRGVVFHLVAQQLSTAVLQGRSSAVSVLCDGTSTVVTSGGESVCSEERKLSASESEDGHGVLRTPVREPRSPFVK
jgi:hypothetical protein